MLEIRPAKCHTRESVDPVISSVSGILDRPPSRAIDGMSRHCERSEAIQRQQASKMDCVAFLAMTRIDTPPLSRARITPELCMILPPSEIKGAGNAGCPMHPQPRVQRSRKHTSVVTVGLTGITRHSRTQWFYGLFRALPGDRALLSPSPAEDASRQLDASVEASGPHDFAVRNKARSSVSAIRVHRIPRPRP